MNMLAKTQTAGEVNGAKSTLTAEPVMKRLFMNSLLNCRFTFQNGKEAVFLAGKYVTDNPAEIYELEREIEVGHPHIYIDPARREIDVTFRDPVEAIKKAAIEEYLAAQTQALDITKDGGHTINGPLTVNNTALMADAMSGSTSTDGGGTAAVSQSAGTAKIVAGPKA